MSAVPSRIARDVARPSCDGAPRLALGAALYFFLVSVAAASVALPLVSRLNPGTHGWTTFVILGTIATIAQLFVVVTPRNQS